MGFTLDEIKRLLAASKDEKFRSEEVHAFAMSKAKEIEDKIRNLHQMKALLENLAEKCPGYGVPKAECPIIKKLMKE